jgi:hypothetical protein
MMVPQHLQVFLAVGALYTWRRLEIEAAVEWNPWFSVERGSIAAGSLNLYGLAAVRWPVSPTVDLRSGLGAGIAVLDHVVFNRTGYFSFMESGLQF